MKKVYLDENLSHFLAEALNLVNKGYYPNIQILSTKQIFGEGVKDEDLIPKIGETGGVLITKDISIKRRKHQYKLCEEFNLGIIFLELSNTKCKNMDIFVLLVNNWEKLMDHVQKTKTPFSIKVNSKALKVL